MRWLYDGRLGLITGGVLCIVKSLDNFCPRITTISLAPSYSYGNSLGLIRRLPKEIQADVARCKAKDSYAIKHAHNSIKLYMPSHVRKYN